MINGNGRKEGRKARWMDGWMDAGEMVNGNGWKEGRKEGKNLQITYDFK